MRISEAITHSWQRSLQKRKPKRRWQVLCLPKRWRSYIPHTVAREIGVGDHNFGAVAHFCLIVSEIARIFGKSFSSSKRVPHFSVKLLFEKF
jgi:hypothetical protein